MAKQDDARARVELRDALRGAAIETGDVLAYRHPTCPSRVFMRLRRGEIAVQDELDLHGADQKIAERMLRDFIHEARYQGFGCVRVIHGKGSHDSGSIAERNHPILKNLVDRLLRQRSDVLAFHSTPPRQGGTGAVLVLLTPRKT